MFGAQLVNMLSNAVECVLSEYTIVYEHDRVDKIRVDSTWQHVQGIRALRLIYLFTLSLVKAVHAIWLSCSMIEESS